MSRFEDTPDLFGTGGQSTTAPITWLQKAVDEIESSNNDDAINAALVDFIARDFGELSYRIGIYNGRVLASKNL